MIASLIDLPQGRCSTPAHQTSAVQITFCNAGGELWYCCFFTPSAITSRCLWWFQVFKCQTCLQPSYALEASTSSMLVWFRMHLRQSNIDWSIHQQHLIHGKIFTTAKRIDPGIAIAIAVLKSKCIEIDNSLHFVDWLVSSALDHIVLIRHLIHKLSRAAITSWGGSQIMNQTMRCFSQLEKGHCDVCWCLIDSWTV